jgi:hypothetical protein
MEDDELEMEHFKRIVKSFKSYRYFYINLNDLAKFLIIKINSKQHSQIYSFFAQKRVAKSLAYYHELPARHRDYVADFEDNCKKLLELIEHNSGIIDLIVEDVESMFQNSTRSIEVRIKPVYCVIR